MMTVVLLMCFNHPLGLIYFVGGPDTRQQRGGHDMVYSLG